MTNPDDGAKDDWSPDKIRTLMNAPPPPGAAGQILQDEIARSSWRHQPEVINLAFQSFVENFVDPGLSIERRAMEWKYSPSLVKISEQEAADRLFRTLPEEERKPILDKWDAAYKERRVREVTSPTTLDTFSPRPR
jgi:hypothetical protein